MRLPSDLRFIFQHPMPTLSRRVLLRTVATSSAMLLLAACQSTAQPTAAPTSPPPQPTTPPKPAAAPTTAPPAAAAPAASNGNPVGPFMAEDSAEWKAILDAAQKESSLTVYGSQHPIIKEQAPNFPQKFGFKLDFVELRGAEAMDRIHAEKDANKPIASVLETGDSAVYPVYAEGGLQLVQGLPNGARIHPAEFAIFNETQNYSWPVWDQIEGIIYNTDLVPPDQVPKSYHDLVDPRWNGKIAMLDPAARMSAFIELTLEDPNFGEAYHQQLAAQDLLLVQSGGDFEAAVARGERALAPGPPSAPSRQQGAPMKWIAMQEGVFRSVFAIGVIKDAPAPNAARVFLNYLLSPEFQTEIGQKLLDTPAITGITHPMGLTLDNLQLFGNAQGRQKVQGNPDVMKKALAIYDHR